MADDLSTPWIEKWACPLCTFQNPISTPTCEMCETDRPNNEPSQVVPSDTAEVGFFPFVVVKKKKEKKKKEDKNLGASVSFFSSFFF